MSAVAQLQDHRQPVPRQPGRIAPREAAKLATAARPAGVTTPAGRHLLELLLRLTRGNFARELPMYWLADELDVSKRTAIRAVHDLIRAGLVIRTVTGLGHTTARYLVNVDLCQLLRSRDEAETEAPTFTPLSPPVHPGESADPSPIGRCQVDTSEVTSWQFRGDKLSPPYARARGGTPSYSLPPYPPERSPAPPAPESSPPGGGAPFFKTGDIDQRCPHGRSVAQGGCRACGTTARQLVDQRQQVTRLSAIEQKVRDQANRRAEEAELRAAATPAPPELKAIIRSRRARP